MALFYSGLFIIFVAQLRYMNTQTNDNTSKEIDKKEAAKHLKRLIIGVILAVIGYLLLKK